MSKMSNIRQVIYLSDDYCLVDENSDCVFDATFVDLSGALAISDSMALLPLQLATHDGAKVHIRDAIFNGLVKPSRITELMRAKAVSHWLGHFNYCVKCGTPRAAFQDDLGSTCSNCGHIQYPQVSPCMIVLVENEDHCLLAHHRRHVNTPIYSTLAGFVEAGESIERCVHREVKEEANISVHNLSYFSSQAWPMPNQLMVGFHAQYREGEIKGCDEEIVDLQWFKYDELPAIPPETTIAGQLIRDFVSRRTALNN